MLDPAQTREILQSSSARILLCVLDGLGGLPMQPGGQTELESARTPNLDALAQRSALGLHIPVAWGITPGSGPAHLALFGYDPIKYRIGRGVLEALGIDFDLRDTDVAARGNFATVNSDGVLTDRRAGRMSTEASSALVDKLAGIPLDRAEAIVRPVREHRFVLVLRGEGLSDAITDSDPNREGVPPLEIRALRPEAERTADLAREFSRTASKVLASASPANAALLRGFAKHPRLPTLQDNFGLRPAAVATYPMYRGLGKLVGMTALPTGGSLNQQIDTLRANWNSYDFFFLHFKKTDAAGEDGDFERKVAAIEEFDAALPAILALNADVLAITGDHSTPAVLKGHSWHPVPLLINARNERPDFATSFGERVCHGGSLGTRPAMELMPLLLANAGRLAKYGA